MTCVCDNDLISWAIGYEMYLYVMFYAVFCGSCVIEGHLIAITLHSINRTNISDVESLEMGAL
jgi:hypothetical protein